MQFLIHGIHITENLLHHKLADVRRILDDKGYCEDAQQGSGDASHFIPATGAAQNELLTTVRFDDAGFVMDDGVSLSGNE